MTDARLFIYSYPADEFPKPNPLAVTEIHMDDMQDMGARTYLMSLKNALKQIPSGTDFRTVDWNSDSADNALRKVIGGFPIFHKRIRSDEAETLWVTIKRDRSDIAYGFWLSKVSIQNL